MTRPWYPAVSDFLSWIGGIAHDTPKHMEPLMKSLYAERVSWLVFVCGLSMALTESPVMKLSSGYNMPVVGIGTWLLEPNDVDEAIGIALSSGYRHIDTAFLYGNEEAIGRSLRKFAHQGGKRENLFITTKLPIHAVRAPDVEIYLKLSLKTLGLEYVDLYLIHLPAGVKKDENGNIAWNQDGTIGVDMTTDLIATWKAMEDQVEAGLAKSIGLSNFNESQILRVIQNSKVKPSNLQVEVHAYNQQKQLRDFCNKQNISVTAYSTLGSIAGRQFQTKSSQKLPDLLKIPIVQEIARNHNKTTAQVLLRHQIQEGLIVIPKSTNPNRIRDNINIFDFELTEAELRQLDSLDRGEGGRLYDLTGYTGIDKHPEYPFTSYQSSQKSKA